MEPAQEDQLLRNALALLHRFRYGRGPFGRLWVTANVPLALSLVTGLPITLATFFFEYIISYSLVSLLFPMVLLLASSHSLRLLPNLLRLHRQASSSIADGPLFRFLVHSDGHVWVTQDAESVETDPNVEVPRQQHHRAAHPVHLHPALAGREGRAEGRHHRALTGLCRLLLRRSRRRDLPPPLSRLLESSAHLRSALF